MADQPKLIPPEPTGIELILRDMNKATRESFERDVLLAMNATRIVKEARGATSGSTLELFEAAEYAAWEAAKDRLRKAYTDQLGRPDSLIDSYRKRF